MITPTSASQRIANSLDFFNSPFLRFENVTCLLVVLSILRITIFPLPILGPGGRMHKVSTIQMGVMVKHASCCCRNNAINSRAVIIGVVPHSPNPRASISFAREGAVCCKWKSSKQRLCFCLRCSICKKIQGK